VTNASDGFREPSSTTASVVVPTQDDADPVFGQQNMAHTVPEDILGLLSGTFTASLGLHLLQASGAVTGGTAGVALLLDYATTLPFWALFAIVNLPFAVLALWKKGLDFTVRTAISIGLVSAFSVLHNAAFPIPQIDPVYGTFAGNLLAGIGLLILFRHRASLGGITIIALIVQERLGFRAGWTQMIFDVAIIVAALWVVPWQFVLLSAAGAVLLSLVLALNHRPGRYVGH
jgi:uncharacterized membrane-anchored protein YitT (DUF2179 family)